MKDARKIAVYSRKSKFTGKGESIENQIELCLRYIAAHNGEGAAAGAAVYEDEGFSGGNLERPQFKRMIADIKAGLISDVVVYRLDRISRNIGDFAGLINELSDLQVSFVSIKEQFDTSSPMGRAMMYIASVFSQLERETIAERIRDNMHELAKTGRWLGGTTPTGYRSEAVEKLTVDGKVKKACMLGLVPEEAEVVKLIFKTFLETNSLTGTDAQLLQNGLVTKNGKRFTRFAIKNILTNPVYMTADTDAYRYLIRQQADLFSQESDFDGVHGIMAYNRTIQKAGRANQVRPVNEWIVSVGRHRGLVSGADWVQAQKLLEQNRSKSFHKSRSNVALLSGVLFCRECGDYMRPKLSTRTDAGGELLYSYLCSLKERSRGHCCNIRNANGNMLDKAVLAEVKELPADAFTVIQRLEQSKKALAENRESGNADLERLRQAVSENEREIKGLAAALSKAGGSSAEPYIVEQIDERHQKNESHKRRIAELTQTTAGQALSDCEFGMLRKLLSSFAATIDDMTVEQKRAAVRACVRRVLWDGENIHIYLLGAEDTAEPRGEDSKCNAIITALSSVRVDGCAPNPEKWSLLRRVSARMLLMTRHSPEGTSYAPLYLHSFRFVQPHTIVEAEKFNIRYAQPSQIDNTADKLRWYRYQKGLLQRDVADYLGIDRSTYVHYEDGTKERYPVAEMDAIAELFAIQVEELPDDYNRFLLNGQGCQVITLRQKLGLSVKEFAAQAGVYPSTVRKWENDSATMTKTTWKKAFEPQY